MVAEQSKSEEKEELVTMAKNTKDLASSEPDVKSTTTATNRRKNRPKRKYHSKKNNDSFKKDKETGTNDPAWYSQSPELLRDAASIPFSWPVGTPLRTSSKIGCDVVPGVLSVHLKPTIGTSLNQNSPANVAASAIYSWVRHANSGHSNYDAPDLMMYLLAMSNVYSLVTWMQRLYGYVNLYDQRNRYLPTVLASADCVNFASIRDNLADFRYFLNSYINKVASLAVPNTMPIFNRLAFLYSNIYCEGPSVKDQMYMYTPENLGWYRFEIDSDTGLGKLVLSYMYTGTNVTFQDIKTYATDMFVRIWEQEDFGIMSGDILKAYDGNVIKLASVPEEMNLVPIYDAMVLHQIKNAKTLRGVTVGPITQTANGLIAQSIVMDSTLSALQQAIVYQDGLRDKILSTDFDNPTPEVVIESTRLMPAYDAYAGVWRTGTEIVSKTRVWSYDSTGGSIISHNDWSYATAWDTTGTNTSNLEELVKCAMFNAPFKYHPEIIIWGYDGNSVVDGKSYRMWDIDNYAVLSNNDLIKMHEAALMSLFAVPAIAKIQ